MSDGDRIPASLRSVQSQRARLTPSACWFKEELNLSEVTQLGSNPRSADLSAPSTALSAVVFAPEWRFRKRDKRSGQQ